MKKLYWGLALLVIASPLGLLARGTAWGEWSAQEFKAMVGFVPGGMRAVESLWRAPLSGYAVPGWEGGPAGAVGYVLSGALGVCLILIVFKILGHFLVGPESDGTDHEDT